MECHDEMTRAKIRSLNDRLRTTGTGGRTHITRAVAALPAETLGRLRKAVSEFADFNRRNDPWGEHDFGKVEFDGTPYFWKIDYYDVNLEWGSPDPADEAITCRVLTIMTGQDM